MPSPLSCNASGCFGEAATRAFAYRFQAAHPQHQMPNDMQAGCYAATLHYLKAVAKLGSAEGGAVAAAMNAMPTDDPLFGKGMIRQDGLTIHPVYLMQAKSPAESRGNWDFFKLVGVVPADQAYRPLNEGHCPLVSGQTAQEERMSETSVQRVAVIGTGLIGAS